MPKCSAELVLKMSASKKSLDYLSDDGDSDQTTEKAVNIQCILNIKVLYHFDPVL